MNLIDLTAKDLRRAASIQERIADLQRELATVLSFDSANGTPRTNPKRHMSAGAKAKLRKIARARWAKARASGRNAL